MSLRYQISIRILIISCIVFFLGGAIAIWQARNAVRKEVDSSINLTLQLVKLNLSLPTSELSAVTGWLSRLNDLQQTRHLHIKLKNSGGQIIDTLQGQRDVSKDNPPPRWFINLVTSHYPKIEYPITAAHGPPLTLIIQANPLDEITEVWHETLAFFITIGCLVAFSFVAVHRVFNKTLGAIDIIKDNLHLIETGEYQKKLPKFEILEYDRIAQAINHMTCVLEQTQKQNRALTQHSLQIQEEERRHLARELHDELGQSLTAIKVMAVTATHKAPHINNIMTTIAEQCDHLMNVVRSMMHQLHPLMLSELGLAATLEDLSRNWLKRYPDLSLFLHCNAEEVDKLDERISIQVFRIIQECLTNTVRHAQATQTHITLHLEQKTNTLHLQVNDNGQGCRIDQINAGFGLLGLAERVKSLGGQCKITSQPGQGMQISVQIPL